MSDDVDATVRAHHLVIVANRLPIHDVDGEWRRSPGGLVSAMLGVLRSRTGAWVGWNGKLDQTEDDLALPTIQEIDGADLVSVPLSSDEFSHYYEGVANGALWPLFHDAIRESTFDADSWVTYREVNRRFATATARSAAPGATAWIHDYHLLLVPAMLREIRPDLVIGFFLHIPFPPQELFMRMPWREEILRGMLGADLVGFQRSVGAENFVALCRRLLGVEADHDQVHSEDDRRVRVGAFPISIDVHEIEQLARRPDIGARAVEIRERLGNPTTVFLGVDRLDYTKGIDLRLISFGSLLRAHTDTTSTPQSAPIVLVQVAVPGRQGVESYVEERRTVEQLVGSVNGEHAAIGYPVVHYIRRGLTLEELVPLYLAADIMLVTPRRDGMNLVAKEFVAARLHDRGVLILSEFAGAADELTDAILVNPHDPDAVEMAMDMALTMDPDEVEHRMSNMRKVVTTHDVHEWARTFLCDLTETGDHG